MRRPIRRGGTAFLGAQFSVNSGRWAWWWASETSTTAPASPALRRGVGTAWPRGRAVPTRTWRGRGGGRPRVPGRRGPWGCGAGPRTRGRPVPRPSGPRSARCHRCRERQRGTDPPGVPRGAHHSMGRRPGPFRTRGQPGSRDPRGRNRPRGGRRSVRARGAASYHVIARRWWGRGGRSASRPFGPARRAGRSSPGWGLGLEVLGWARAGYSPRPSAGPDGRVEGGAPEEGGVIRLRARNGRSGLTGSYWGFPSTSTRRPSGVAAGTGAASPDRPRGRPRRGGTGPSPRTRTPLVTVRVVARHEARDLEPRHAEGLTN